MAEIIDLNLAELTRALRDGEVSSLEVTHAFLKRAEQQNPELNAFISLTPELAETHARAADQKLQAYRQKEVMEISPLTGIPIAIKDLIMVEGFQCTAGSCILEGFVAPYHATAAKRLLDCGMVVLGKTNTDEFAMGSSTENSGYGVTHNPWDRTRVPGGSSGGSAAAVSARLAPVALGTDTGGSVRQPAAFCGVTGLKPTYGQVSRYGLIAYGSSLDTIGVLSQSAEEAYKVFTNMAGHDPLDATSLKSPFSTEWGEEIVDLEGLRIGIPLEYFGESLQPEIEASIQAVMDLFADLGVETVDISLPHTEYAVPVYYLVATAEASANLARYDGIRYGPRLEGENLEDIYKHTRGELFGDEVKRRIMLGTFGLSAGYYDAYYGKAQQVRQLMRQDFDLAFEKVDIIAAPVAPTTAFKIGAHKDDPLAMYLEDIFTLPANLAGIPGVSFPIGFDGENLPIGMQFLGPMSSEIKLLRLVDRYQQVTDWHTKMPPVDS